MPAADQKSILVAEDNIVLSDVLRFNFERSGFVVTVAHTGSEALQRLQEDPYDLLFTDYNMPGVNGEELISAIRGEFGLADLPIVMCSAKGMELDVGRRAEKWGVAHVIFKPFSVRDVVALARSLTAAQINNPQPMLAP